MTDTESKRTRLFFGKVNHRRITETLIEITDCALAKGNRNKKVDLFVNCSGGTYEPAIAFYDTMTTKLSDIQLSTLAMGEVGSAGLLISLSAPKKNRFVTENAIIFLHEVGFERKNKKRITVTHKRIKRLLLKEERQELRRAQKIYTSVLAKETGTSFKTLEKMMRRNTYLNAKQAVKYGFASKIVKSER